MDRRERRLAAIPGRSVAVLMGALRSAEGKARVGRARAGTSAALPR